MGDFFNIKKAGTTALWFWGIFGLYTGGMAILEGRIGVGVFITATAILAFYILWQRRRESKTKTPSHDKE